MKRPLAIAILVGTIAFTGVWSAAWWSTDAQRAKSFLLSASSEYSNPILTSFRIGADRSRFRYWLSTPTGRKFIQVVVDKKNDQVALEE